MNIENIEGIQSYMISYMPSRSGNKKHYSYGKLMYNGYKIDLEIEYYLTLDEAVQGLKDRLKKAIEDFKIPVK